MPDHTQQHLIELHRKVPGGVSIRTNVQTPDGFQVVVTWVWRSRADRCIPCMVTGDDLDLALRRAIILEEDLAEFGESGAGQ